MWGVMTLSGYRHNVFFGCGTHEIKIKVKGEGQECPFRGGCTALRAADSRGRLSPHEPWRCTQTAGSSPAFGGLGMTKVYLAF
jgi:hypothetical protein